MNEQLQEVYLNIFVWTVTLFILFDKNLIFLLYKTIYVPSESIINQSTLSKKYMFLEPASGLKIFINSLQVSESGLVSQSEFWWCIGTRIGIVMKFGIIPSLIYIWVSKLFYLFFSFNMVMLSVCVSVLSVNIQFGIHFFVSSYLFNDSSNKMHIMCIP